MSIYYETSENEDEWMCIAHLRQWTHPYYRCPLCMADTLTNGEGHAELTTDYSGEIRVSCPVLPTCSWEYATPDDKQPTLFGLVLELRKHMRGAH